jgi:L-glyceraldehyde 3-phosphate reductase
MSTASGKHQTADTTDRASRYASMPMQRCGAQGLPLPALALGLWQGFGELDPIANQRALLRKAFDLGIVHFDLAATYGPPEGAAEEALGRSLRTDFLHHRDELIIATKAGHIGDSNGPQGPYRVNASRKSLLSSLDRSLRRLGIDYVDIFYLHYADPATPVEESMGALDQAVRQGKALYVGISNHDPQQARAAAAALRTLGTPCLIQQENYSMFNRRLEHGGFDALGGAGIGCLVFGSLCQGLLTDRYLGSVPDDSRLAKKRGGGTLAPDFISPRAFDQIRRLNAIASERGQTLAQMAVCWAMRDPRVTAALIGASRPEQIADIASGLARRAFAAEELERIDAILA